MTKVTILLLLAICTSLNGQNLDVEGKVKVGNMDAATNAAEPIAREPDGTLALLSAIPAGLAIGDFIQGGVVFWISSNGNHVKVVSIYDSRAPYSNVQVTEIRGASSNINGAGNTVAIMMQSGHIESAARQCADLAYDGYDDWYLPSKEELSAIYQNRVAINATAIAYGGESFKAIPYWSSTETGSNTAAHHDFHTGTQGNTYKGSESYVRAIRAFSR